MIRALKLLGAVCAVLFFILAMAITVAISRPPAHPRHPGFGD